MIVDCHVNIWNDEDVRPLFREQMARIRPGGMELKADADTLHAAMAEVDRAIVFAIGYGDSAGVQSEDATTAACVAKYPDKFVGFAYADPRRPDCLERLRFATGELGLKGVKYGPIYNGVPLDDPRMEPVYEHCVANDLPLTMHMGTTFGADAPLELGRPIHVDAVARRHPDLKMVLAHMGHPWFEECVAVIRKQPSLRRGLGHLLPSVAVLEHAGLRPGVPRHRQDLLGHRFPVLGRGGERRGAAGCQPGRRGHRPAARGSRDDRAHPPQQPVRALVAPRQPGLTSATFPPEAGRAILRW